MADNIRSLPSRYKKSCAILNWQLCFNYIVQTVGKIIEDGDNYAAQGKRNGLKDSKKNISGFSGKPVALRTIALVNVKLGQTDTVISGTPHIDHSPLSTLPKFRCVGSLISLPEPRDTADKPAEPSSVTRWFMLPVTDSKF